MGLSTYSEERSVNFARIRLQKKLLFIVLISSTLITTLVFGLTIVYDYRLEVTQLGRTAEGIQKSFIQPLSKAIQEKDQNQLQAQMRTILNFSEVTSVKIRFHSNTKTTLAENEEYLQDAENSPNNRVFTYELKMPGTDGEQLLGFLDIQFNTSEMMDKLYAKSVVYLSLQTLKTLLLSAVLLWIFQKVVTDRLQRVIDYLKHADLTSTKTRQTLHNLAHQNQLDEINSLGRAVNRLTFKVALFNELNDKKLLEKNEQLQIQELKAANASKLASLGEMASGIAHEINNPLAIIQTNVELIKLHLEQPIPDKTEIYNGIEKIKTTSERIATIIRGLRTFSRNSENDPFIKAQLSDIVQETLSFCSEKFRNQNIELKIDIPEPIEIECRPSQISQILLNLLNNAADAVCDLPEKWVYLSAQRHSTHFEIRVLDSGDGIPLQLQHKIMLPFFTTKEIGKGTGLGLSISKGIAAQHGGSLELNNDSANTEFVIILPYKQKKQSGHQAA